MNSFQYLRAAAVPDAVRAVAGQPGARFLAGGTTMLDLMKCGVEAPSALVDITRLPGLAGIEIDQTRVRIGARNLFDEQPPLADSDLGFLGELHSPRGRVIYASIRKRF